MQRLFTMLVLAAVLAGCGGAPPTPYAGFAVPWGEGDRAEYDVVRGGVIEGTSVFTAERKGEGYVLSSETILGTLKDTTRVAVDKSLKPAQATHQVTGMGKYDVTLASRYEKGKLYIQAKTAEGDKSATLDVPPDAYDNDQLLTTLRALPLAEGYVLTFTNMASGNPVKTEVKVVGTERLDVPAGTYTAYKVELNFGQGKHYVWYDVNQPHHFVKYENPDVQRVFVLTKVGTP